MKKKIPFRESRFLTSALSPEEWPSTHLPEIALVGRSNVGKSSLINHFLETKYLAKVSSKPGKTQRINFFSIDNSLLLVDLPGYGYAKASKKKQEEWSYFLDLYIKKRALTGILFLCDMRRTLNEDDCLLLQWAEHKKIPLICILTKADKLSLKEQKASISQFENKLKNHPFLSYSIKEGKCRHHLRSQIDALISTQTLSSGV